jgi:hypothetical protein
MESGIEWYFYAGVPAASAAYYPEVMSEWRSIDDASTSKSGVIRICRAIRAVTVP